MNFLRPPLLALLMCATAASAGAKSFDAVGKVVYVDDGDTLVMLIDGARQMKVRLANIDAPESSHTNKQKGRIGQPYSSNSGAALSQMVKGRTVNVHCFEQDRYRRDVCEIFADGRSVNTEMVRQGWAWANNSYGGRYLRDKSLNGIEQGARARQAGLWAGRTPTPPWDWRKQCWEQGQCTQ